MKKGKGSLVPVFFLVLSVLLYFMVFVTCVQGLIIPDHTWRVYLIPYSIYAAFSLLAAMRRTNKLVTLFLTLVFLFIAWVVMPINLFNIYGQATDTNITDINSYERVLEVVDYPNNELVKFFPSRIPKSLQVINFVYDPSGYMEGELLILDFKTNESDVEKYVRSFEADAIWSGLYQGENITNEMQYIEIPWSSFEGVLKPDRQVYIFECKSSKASSWSYPKISLAQVDNDNSEIMLYMEN